MKIKELLDVCQYYKIKLHSGFNGSLIATSRESLQKYGEVDVLSICPKMNVSNDGTFATAYLYVFGDACQIREVKRNL